MRDADAEHLLGQDVIDALLKVRNLARQALGEAAGDLAQEHARLRARVEERHRLVRPDVRAVVVGRPRLGQRVQHPVRELGRREHLVVREVRDARQHIRVAAAQRKARLRRSCGLLRRRRRSGGQFAHRHRRVGLGRREDLVLAEMGEERALRAEGRRAE